MSKTYPEHNKVRAIKADLDTINRFLDWLMMERERPVRLMLPYSAEVDEAGKAVYRNYGGDVVEDWKPITLNDNLKVTEAKEKRQQKEGIDRQMVYDQHGTTFSDLRPRREALMSEYFEIDEDKMEAEKREMLAALRGG